MLIGFTGRAGAGKDHCFRTLHALYSGPFTVERRSFADLLYRSAAEALGVTPGQLRDWKRRGVRIMVREPLEDGDYVEHASLTVRQYLQRYGTEAHREVFDREFWIKAADMEHRNKIVAFTDVRFPNEARAIIEAGGVVFQVEGLDDGLGDSHDSELPMPRHLVHAIVDNTDHGPGVLERELGAAVETYILEAL